MNFIIKTHQGKSGENHKLMTVRWSCFIRNTQLKAMYWPLRSHNASILQFGVRTPHDGKAVHGAAPLER